MTTYLKRGAKRTPRLDVRLRSGNIVVSGDPVVDADADADAAAAAAAAVVVVVLALPFATWRA